jgi:hypothetical protein
MSQALPDPGGRPALAQICPAHVGLLFDTAVLVTFRRSPLEPFWLHDAR